MYNMITSNAFRAQLSGASLLKEPKVRPTHANRMEQGTPGANVNSHSLLSLTYPIVRRLAIECGHK
eukprot:2658342-Lingulodinium_polyedra.AAC.1